MRNLSIFASVLVLSLSSLAFGQQSEEELCKLYSGDWQMEDVKAGYVGGAPLTEEEINSMFSEENRKQNVTGTLENETKVCTFSILVGDDEEAIELKMDGKEYIETETDGTAQNKLVNVSKWVENQSIDEDPTFQSKTKQIDTVLTEEMVDESERSKISTRLLLTSIDQGHLRSEILFSFEGTDGEGKPVSNKLWVKSTMKRVK